ncbi:protein of unassigned function [Methylobacterium oryzae CBMB20]|uniref:Protein of unassigned function n=1 Tax=Methylobacterium oryzae CBMB20 TaxID=693986 RepID=A0A089P074_9HYPH|nr:protein of unassigned function [Methylobacterium oryzae CBMB20]
MRAILLASVTGSPSPSCDMRQRTFEIALGVIIILHRMRFCLR